MVNDVIPADQDLSIARYLVILDTSYGSQDRKWHCSAIWDRGRTGKRLHRLTGCKPGEVFVTNSCAERGAGPRNHGQLNPAWLRETLHMLPAPLAALPLLVMGKVARNTYGQTGWKHGGPVYLGPHPAARREWTHPALEEEGRRIRAMKAAGSLMDHRVSQ